jgi:HSP20 family protein
MANIVRRRGESVEPSLRGGGWDPFRMMEEMLRWDPFLQGPSLAQFERGTFVPHFEVCETRDAYIFKADVPGVKEEDLEISLTGSRLTISGHREAEERTENERFYAAERVYGHFTRTFTLPEGVDDQHVQAELKNGVLSLAISKRPELQPKKIPLKGQGLGQKPGKA